ncbi:MAG: NAD(P)H-dependent oxidoreductase [Deltaproteobacteria bacterium]|nr:NAD(P)H-dependent oxidoreductase [Deltaproteobacteria bacterium]MBW2018910.1 NAD(P)H-dependent oxidoreductase [Deltaproteobacteria bacterium]MBW2073665.1 NAD(P)H-dependent oxidoreductase [Deltaproteobacteria bacterium]RLB81169.1 MAG: flavodoxin family protein [Deltaproteobacteria bacterium]
MKISVILAHPNKKSFNHAIAEAALNTLQEKGHDIYFHDLYEENFDPILPIEEISKDAPLPHQIKNYCDELTESDGIIIIHPNWWGQPPAILKGWIDRVIRPGIAYGFLEGDKGEGIPDGLLKGKAVLVFNTSNTPEEREEKVFGDPLETLWKNCIFGLCGVEKFYRKMFRIIIISSEEQRRKWLQEVTDAVSRFFPKYYISHENHEQK